MGTSAQCIKRPRTLAIMTTSIDFGDVEEDGAFWRELLRSESTVITKRGRWVA